MASGNDDPLRAAIATVVGAAGFDLEELKIVSQGGRRIVTVVVDSDDGVDLDAAAAVNREISAAVDELPQEPFQGAPFNLEVTSRGVGAPLTKPRHFLRARGRLVRFHQADSADFDGRIAGVSGNTVLVLTGKGGVTERKLSLESITRATVVVEFSAPSRVVLSKLEQIAARNTLTEGENE